MSRVGDVWLHSVAEISGSARSDALGTRPLGTDDASTVRLPAGGPDEGIRYRLGFTVDVVAYTSRTIDAQRQIQDRLYTILQQFVAEAGTELVPANFQSTGDGYHYFLPDSDLHTAVKHLLTTLPGLLAEDNRTHDERIRLRMATDVGTVGCGPLGFTADAVVNVSRLVISQPIRDAVDQHDTDFVALVSESLYQDVVSRFTDLSALPFQQVDVAVKSYRARAYLLVCQRYYGTTCTTSPTASPS